MWNSVPAISHYYYKRGKKKKKKTQLCYGLKDVSLFKLEIFVLIHRTDWYLQPVLSELVLFSFLKHVIFVGVFIMYKNM